MENPLVTSPHKTWLWRTLATVSILIFLAACFYAEESARGIRTWKAVETEITLRGESLNWSDYIPAPIPDEQNFYKAPMMTEWFVRSTNGAAMTSLSAVLANPENTTNLITESSASNYLAWCDGFAPQLEQIRAALKRPGARIDGPHKVPFADPFPNFVSYRVFSQVMAHRAKCHLLLAQPGEALDDLTMLHQLNMTLVESGEPNVLVAAMIHSAITSLQTDAIGYGLSAHLWREPELVALEKQLAGIHLLPAVRQSLLAERAGQCQLLETSSLDRFMRLTGSDAVAANLGWILVPSGWIYQNKAAIARAEGRMLDSIDFSNRTVSPYKSKAAAIYLDRTFQHRTPFNFVAAVVVPNFTKAGKIMARNQTWVDHTLIVCALERYRLKNGNCPEKLLSLAPQFLEKIPQDIITGNPMLYVRKDEQNFIVYSVGWNEMDDGGIISRQGDGKEDMDNGDWVWHYPQL